ncbi:uncharacterized protein LOC144912946 [Branchiostoma floridae x Branchiostoma belcheri]
MHSVSLQCNVDFTFTVRGKKRIRPESRRDDDGAGPSGVGRDTQPTSAVRGKKRIRPESRRDDDGAGPSGVGRDTQPTSAADMQECFEKVITGVSRKWDDLARKLGFNENEIVGIHNDKLDQDHRCWEMLLRWRNREARGATLQILKQALISIGERLTAESL